MKGKLTFNDRARGPRLALAALILLAALALPANADTQYFYVATNGSDSNPGTLAQPFATIEKARDVIRVAHPLQHPYEVRIRGGVYRPAATIVFTPADSGTAQYPITYKAYNNELAAVSGGRVVSSADWIYVGGNYPETYVNYLADELGTFSQKITQVYCDGVRLEMARYPNKVDPYQDMNNYFASFMLTQLAGAPRADAAKLPVWRTNWTPGWNVEPQLVVFNPDGSDCLSNVLNFYGPYCDPPNRIAAFPPGAENQALAPFSSGRRCYVRGIINELDSRGEWHVQYVTPQSVFVRTPDGTSPAGHQISVGFLDTIIKLEGIDAGNQVQYLTFRGLEFRETTCQNETGKADTPQNGGIYMVYANHCALQDCKLPDLASNAVCMEWNCSYNTIRDCRITGPGACGVLVPQSYVNGQYTLRDFDSHHLILGNIFSNVGTLHKGSGAITIWDVAANEISSNYMVNLPRAGILLVNQTGGNNMIRWNEITNNCWETADTGAIHTSSAYYNETDNYIATNFLWNTRGYGVTTGGAVVGGAYGIYLDNLSSGWSVLDNVSAWSMIGAIVNGGNNNTLNNNFIIYTWGTQLTMNSFWYPVMMTNNNFWHNIFYYYPSFPGANFFASGYYQGTSIPVYPTASNCNCIYGSNQPIPVTAPGVANWTQWQALGFDTAWTIADPLITNIGANVYTLQPGSPALAYGIHGLDMSPQFVVQPQSLTVAAGQPANLAVGVQCPAPLYQWYFAPPGGNWSAIPGATHPIYTVDATAEANEGYYYCSVTGIINWHGTAYASAMAYLTVN